MSGDERLERLYDYTKFHLGLYITASGALLALYGSKDSEWLGKALVGNSDLVVASILAMFVAGMAGGIIASTCTVVSSFDKLWYGRTGPLNMKLLRGSHWAAIEHAAFWTSAILIGLAFIKT